MGKVGIHIQCPFGIYILRPFGTIYGRLVTRCGIGIVSSKIWQPWQRAQMYLVAIWYIFPRFGILRQEKSGNPGKEHKCTNVKEVVEHASS
jgi:hypothetical protein